MPAAREVSRSHVSDHLGANSKDCHNLLVFHNLLFSFSMDHRIKDNLILTIALWLLRTQTKISQMKYKFRGLRGSKHKALPWNRCVMLPNTCSPARTCPRVLTTCYWGSAIDRMTGFVLHLTTWKRPSQLKSLTINHTVDLSSEWLAFILSHFVSHQNSSVIQEAHQ